jgi:hypothetical protein
MIGTIRVLMLLSFVSLLLLFVPADAAAEESLVPTFQNLSELQTAIDYVWILASSALVFLMQAGFMALESGLARAKNSINIAIKNMVDFVMSIAGFWLIGFGLMFGQSFHGLIGTSDYLMDIGANPWRALTSGRPGRRKNGYENSSKKSSGVPMESSGISALIWERMWKQYACRLAR